MTKKSFHKSVFFKYLITYLMIMIIPIVFLYSFVSGDLMNVLTQGFEKDNQKTLEKMSIIIDGKINELEKIKREFAVNPSIYSSRNLKDVPNAVELIRQMGRQAAINDFIYDMAIYSEKDRYIYTSKASCVFDTYVDTHVRYKDIESNNIRTLIEGCSGVKIIPQNQVSFNNDNVDVITLISSIDDTSSRKSNMIFFIDKGYIDKLIDTRKSTYIIVDSEGRIIYTSKKDLEDINQIVEKSQKKSLIRYNNAIVSTCESTMYGLRYISITSEGEVYDTVNMLRHKLILLMIVLLVIGVLVITFSMEINYKPIKQINEKIIDEIPYRSDTGNELKHITESLDYLNSQNQSLKEKDMLFTKNMVLKKLLGGKYISEEQFKEDADSCGMEFKEKCYCVICLILLKKDRSSGEDKLEALKKCICEFYHGHIYSELLNKYTFITDLNDNEKTLFPETVSFMYEELRKRFSEYRISIGVSEFTSDIKEINMCYEEAMAAREYSFVKGDNTVVFQCDLNFQNDSIYPYYLVEKFQNALNSNNMGIAREAIDEIKAHIKKTKSPIYCSRSIYYNLISVLSSALSKEEKGKVNLDIGNSKSNKSIELYNIDELMEQVIKIVGSIEKMRSDAKGKGSSGDELLSAIEDEIKKSYCDPNFSVECLADKFDLRLANISSYFKSRTGKTIIGYITELRIDKARRLLIETDMTLNDIVEEIGYINVSSFIRKFKSVYGITPGQFAKENKKTSSDN